MVAPPSFDASPGHLLLPRPAMAASPSWRRPDTRENTVNYARHFIRHSRCQSHATWTLLRPRGKAYDLMRLRRLGPWRSWRTATVNEIAKRTRINCARTTAAAARCYTCCSQLHFRALFAVAWQIAFARCFTAISIAGYNVDEQTYALKLKLNVCGAQHPKIRASLGDCSRDGSGRIHLTKYAFQELTDVRASN